MKTLIKPSELLQFRLTQINRILKETRSLIKDTETDLYDGLVDPDNDTDWYDCIKREIKEQIDELSKIVRIME